MNPQKTAIIGADGYIGKHLWTELKKFHPDTIGTTYRSNEKKLAYFDIRQADISPLRLEDNGYQAAIICAAKPNVGYCENNQSDSYDVNVRGTLELVRQLGETALQTVFLSTDYVFDGITGNYTDDSSQNPTTEYGRQKAQVEKTIPSLTDRYLIIRIGKIYGLEKGDGTLLDEIASSLASNKPIECAKDQVFCPLYIEDLINSVIEIQSKNQNGVLNLCGAEPWSRYEIAVALSKKMKIELNLVNEISLHDLPSMDGRPLNTTMKCRSHVVQELQKSFKPLSEAIEVVASNYKAVVSSTTKEA